MLIGDPDRFALLIERVPQWESGGFVNGILYVFVGGELFPKELRTTTLNLDLCRLSAEDSPFMAPVTDVVLFALSAKDLFRRLYERTYPEEELNDYRFLVPLQELCDAGYSLFVLSSGERVRLLLGCDEGFIYETVLEHTKFEEIEKRAFEYARTLERD